MSDIPSSFFAHTDPLNWLGTKSQRKYHIVKKYTYLEQGCFLNGRYIQKSIKSYELTGETYCGIFVTKRFIVQDIDKTKLCKHCLNAHAKAYAGENI